MSVLSRTPRRRRRRDRPRATTTVIRGLVVVAVFGLLGFSLLRLYNGLPTTNYGQAYVSVPTVGNLLSHDAVRVGGKRVGQVLHIEVGDDGRPRVELQLDPGTKLPADTEVKVRANGLLGARYIELKPGDDAKLLAEGATITGDQNSYTYGLPEAVDTFNKETRGGLRTTIGVLGAGLLGNGAGLNRLIDIGGTRTSQFDRVMEGILAKPGAAERLLPSLESTFVALDRNSGYTGPFLQAAGDAVQPFVTERDATRATLDAAPAALASANDGLRRGQKLLSAVHDFSDAAAGTLPPAPEGFKELAALLSEARGPVRRAEDTLRDLAYGTDGARDTILAAAPFRNRIKAGVDQARPLLKYVGDYGCDVINAGAVLRSMTGYGQPGTGPNGQAMAFRLQAVIPAGVDAVGIKDQTGLLKRDSYEQPCKYLSKPYPQFVPPSNLAAARSKGR